MEKEQAYAEIMYMFRYYYKDKWAPDNIFANKPRTWIHAFNSLTDQGFIKRRKRYPGFEYKWVAQFPTDY